MTDTADATESSHTGLTLLVWGFRTVQAVLVGLGAILALGAVQMPGLQAMIVLAFVVVLWIGALVVEMLAVKPCKGRA